MYNYYYYILVYYILYIDMYIYLYACIYLTVLFFFVAFFFSIQKLSVLLLFLWFSFASFSSPLGVFARLYTLTVTILRYIGAYICIVIMVIITKCICSSVGWSLRYTRSQLRARGIKKMLLIFLKLISMRALRYGLECRPWKYIAHATNITLFQNYGRCVYG